MQAEENAIKQFMTLELLYKHDLSLSVLSV